jgi:hypothetical protein
VFSVTFGYNTRITKFIAVVIPFRNTKLFFIIILTPTLSKGEGVKIGLFYIANWNNHVTTAITRFTVIKVLNFAIAKHLLLPKPSSNTLPKLQSLAIIKSRKMDIKFLLQLQLELPFVLRL